jgi:hypothetical protein
MKIRNLRTNAANSKFRALSTREVDELINSTILKPLTTTTKESEKRVFNNWDLPIEPIAYLRCKKYDPL